MAHNLQTHIVFIDLTIVYDSVPLAILWRAMENQGISSKYIKSTKQLYKDMTAQVKIGKRISSKVSVSKGLKQGCCIAPTLFKIYLNKALTSWRKKCRNMGVPCLLYTSRCV